MLFDKLFLKNKKGEVPYLLGALIVAIVAAVIVILITSMRAIAGNELVGSVTDDDAVKLCHMNKMDSLGDTYSQEKHDKDNDGVVDYCDRCALNITKDDFEDHQGIQKFLTENDRGYKTYTQFTSNINNDADADGIVDGCDSDPGKPPNTLLGFKDWKVKAECKNIAKKIEGVESNIIEGRGYAQCHLKLG